MNKPIILLIYMSHEVNRTNHSTPRYEAWLVTSRVSVWHDSLCMRDMTHDVSHVCVTWLMMSHIPCTKCTMCGTTHTSKLRRTNHFTLFYEAWLVLSHMYVWHDSLCLTCMRDTSLTQSKIRRTNHSTNIYKAPLILSHMYVWHDIHTKQNQTNQLFC